MKKFALVSLVLLLSVSFSAAAQEPSAPQRNAVGMGDLLVAPTRVIFEGRDRSAELTLVNTGASVATYRISFINLRMSEGGEMVEIEEAGLGEKFADGMIRYSPRQVTLDPNVAQTVRLQVRKPADLDDGEYRSHILFRAVPDLSQVGGGVEGVDNPEELRIRLVPVYGVSLPVIMRHGETGVSLEMSDLAYEPAAEGQPAIVRARLHREGNRSAYVGFTARLRRTGELLGQIKGLGVYVPNEMRSVELALQVPEERDLSGEVLLITVTDAESTEERILAEAELLVR